MHDSYVRVPITAAFRGLTEVSRCKADGNLWCCASVAGQGLGDEDCCQTNLTTSLDPYPFVVEGFISVSSPLSTVNSPNSTTSTGLSPSSYLSASSSTTSSDVSTDPSISLSACNSQLFSASSSQLLSTSTSQLPLTSTSILSATSVPRGGDGLSRSDIIALTIGLTGGLAAVVTMIYGILAFHQRRDQRQRWTSSPFRRRRASATRSRGRTITNLQTRSTNSTMPLR